MKRKVLSLLNHFFESVEFEHQFSSLSIFLIPKVSYPTSLNDFRPISLLGVGAQVNHLGFGG